MEHGYEFTTKIDFGQIERFDGMKSRLNRWKLEIKRDRRASSEFLFLSSVFRKINDAGRGRLETEPPMGFRFGVLRWKFDRTPDRNCLTASKNNQRRLRRLTVDVGPRLVDAPAAPSSSGMCGCRHARVQTLRRLNISDAAQGWPSSGRRPNKFPTLYGGRHNAI